jgi:hypothetical protein
MLQLRKLQEVCVAINNLPIVTNFSNTLNQFTAHILALFFCVLQEVKVAVSI